MSVCRLSKLESNIKGFEQLNYVSHLRAFPPVASCRGKISPRAGTIHVNSSCPSPLQQNVFPAVGACHDMEEVLERQERETRERMRRRAASKRAQRELDEQLGIAVALLEEEKQARRGSREGRRPNVDRHRHSRVETLYTRDYLRRPKPRDLQRLLQKAESRGFPDMIDSIDCMHWQWKNCPTAWQGDYRNRKG
ncbi:hypothetical protein L3X38_040494 [Prunus dulcis]|uniref:Uncharacterized protein n=1 Tax=Prunus dulcis TaxID=3755 RepID=A0AAD4VAE3_PRUDU|nr:hypothetical protein L3X38_040494 [Prunus dulcis]